jgi:large subunit ribosomal protein L15
MPVTYKKRGRKFRAVRTRGYGRVSGHRAKGQKGGTGLTTGMFKYKYSYYLLQKKLGFPDPAWIMGKQGFKTPQSIQRIKKVNTLNIKDLEMHLDSLVESKKATESGGKYVIDLGAMNIQKLLGNGKVTKKLEITVATASKKAVEKMAEAKCKLTLTKKAKEVPKKKGKDKGKGKKSSAAKKKKK